jgi:hypothetical protein
MNQGYFKSLSWVFLCNEDNTHQKFKLQQSAWSSAYRDYQLKDFVCKIALQIMGFEQESLQYVEEN